MRNWNCNSSVNEMGSVSFQTTYEELKRRIESANNLCLRASRLPMRNWNLTSRHVSQDSSTRFQTTYEELKHCRMIDYTRIVGLPDYLWGIETIVGCSCFALLLLPDYLWGIETRRARRKSKVLFCFQTTYEELKPVYHANMSKTV